MSPRLPCVTQEVKLTLRPSTTRMGQFIMCRGFLNDEANGGWVFFVGRNASPGIGCLVQCLPVRPEYDTPFDGRIPEISTA